MVLVTLRAFFTILLLDTKIVIDWVQMSMEMLAYYECSRRYRDQSKISPIESKVFFMV
jgi:hypothetical protein